MVAIHRLKNVKSHFKKYAKKNVHDNKNNSVNFNNVGGATNYNRCVKLGDVTDCRNKVRVAYCNGSIFRNPLKGFRKTLNTTACDIKTEEIYKDPHALWSKNDVCYDKRIRVINNKGGTIDRKYNHSYKEYLRRKCKSYDSHEKRYILSDGTYTTGCKYFKDKQLTVSQIVKSNTGVGGKFQPHDTALAVFTISSGDAPKIGDRIYLSGFTTSEFNNNFEVIGTSTSTFSVDLYEIGNDNVSPNTYNQTGIGSYETKEACGITYKVRNKQYKTNSAVPSSSRIERLKYNTLMQTNKNTCTIGSRTNNPAPYTCGNYSSIQKYKDKNRTYEDFCEGVRFQANPCIRKKIRIGGVMRWSR